MKKFNKIVALLFMLVLVTTIVGCGKEKEEEPLQSMDLSEPNEVDDINLVENGVEVYFSNMPDHIYKIKQTDFLDKVTAGDDMIILDIRRAEHYGENHIKGAINIPWGKTAISDNIDKIPQDKEVLIYCYSGQTAGQVVMALNLAGINARSVNLGWNFGISRVEGYELLTETTVNELSGDTYEVAEEIKTAVSDYFTALMGVADSKFKNNIISEDNLKAMIEAEEDFYLLSIRQEKDYLTEHIVGAANIPWGKGMQEQFSLLPTDKKIVVYCYSGQTAGQTVAGLRFLGLDAVSLNGGIGVEANAPIGWKNKGFEVE